MPETYPCDYEPFECPFNAQYGSDCYNYCGLGADETEPEEYYESEENS